VKGGESEGLLRVRVQPGASRNEVIIAADGTFKVKIAAPPSRGAANRELIKFLSKLLKVPRSSVRIMSGERARDKVVKVDGVPSSQISKKLSAHSAPGG